MAFYENRVYLAGIVGSNVKWSRTINGDEYAWFALELENKLGINSTDNNFHQMLGVMVFNRKLLDYMKRVNLHRRDLVVVFGFASAFKHEVKGEALTAHGINATQIFAVRTTADN